MTKILCVTSGLTGITNASKELVLRLHSFGWEVSYASCKDVRAKFFTLPVDYYQLPAISYDLAVPLPEFVAPGKKIKRLLYKLSHAKSRQKLVDQEIWPAEFIRIVEKVQPELILIDSELNEYVISAFSTNTPVMLLSQWFNHWAGVGLPNIMTDIIPMQGLKGRKPSIWLNWQWTALGRKWTFQKRKFLSAGIDRRTSLLRMADHIEFPKHKIGRNFWPGPFLFRHFPVLSMTAEELEFPYLRKKDFCYSGPMVQLKRNEKYEEATIRKLKEIYTQTKNNNRPLIYSSLSTLHAGDEVFIRKLMEAMRSLKDCEMIISLGGKRSENEFRGTPNNVHVFDFVPQLEVLEQADLSINHGGIHTINECIVLGVPMLVYSGKKSDQNGCAARIHFHKIGIMADKDKDDSKAISSKILNILTSDTIRSNVVRLKEKCTLYGENKTMEHFINEYIERSKLNEKIEAL